MSQRLEGLYAIVPTPAFEGADEWDAVDTVDLAELERLIDALIADGVNGLVALGTTGECATLTRAEYDRTVDCVVSTVAGRVPTFVGTTALGMHEIVDRMRFVRDVGADGTLLGLPMWQPLTHQMAVSFYERLSAGFPDLQIMAYANSRAFRFGFDADFWSQVSEKAPTVTSAKFSKPDRYLEYLEASKGRIQFVPHETALGRFAELAPEATTACWSTCASIGPAPALAMIQAVRDGDRERAASVAGDLKFAAEPLMPFISDPDVFASYNIQIEKARMNAGSYCNAGPTRPPYDHLPDDIAEAATECGRRWTKLQEKYRT